MPSVCVRGGGDGREGRVDGEGQFVALFVSADEKKTFVTWKRGSRQTPTTHDTPQGDEEGERRERRERRRRWGKKEGGERKGEWKRWGG